MNANEISLEDLYSSYTSKEQIKDSFEKRTIPTGRYTFYASKAEARLAADVSPWPGRKMGNFFGQVKDDAGKRLGSVGFDASWEVQHFTDKNGHKRQDAPSSLWGQMAVALGMETASVGDIIKAAGKYPLSVYITEAFKNPETNKYETANTPDERTAFRKKSWDSRNFVRSISKMK